MSSDKIWKQDCVILCGMAGLGFLMGAGLLAIGGVWASAFGVEGLMVGAMFAPCAAWRLMHKS